MLNAIVCAGSTFDTCDIWANVMVRLKQERSIQLKYLFYWEQENRSAAKDILDDENVYFHDHRLAWKGLGFPENLPTEVIDSDDIKRFAEKELIAIKMMDRIDPFLENFTFSMRQNFFRSLICKWLSVIKNMEIGFVIFPSVPHQIVDYALYYVCCLRQIPYITFQHTPFLDASILTDSIDEATSSFDWEYSQEGNIEIDFQKYILKLKNAKPYRPDYMERQVRDNKRNNLILLIATLYVSAKQKKNIKQLIMWSFKTRWSNFVQKNTTPQKSVYTNTQQIIYYFKKCKTLKNWAIKYNNHCTKQLPNKFIFFALHYQPEETTSPSAGHYVDQMLVIDLILNSLPPDVKLVVKEHPSQFLRNNEGTQGRSDMFYDELFLRAERLCIAPVNADSSTIVQKSLGVITLTGTIGIEAAVNNIPVIVLGRSWYEGAPNIYRISNKSELKSIINKIVNAKKKKNIEADMIYWLRKRSNSFVFGTPCGSYNNRSVRKKSESIENLYQAISKYAHLKLKI